MSDVREQKHIHIQTHTHTQLAHMWNVTLQGQTLVIFYESEFYGM
jgi:hypothetical protein